MPDVVALAVQGRRVVDLEEELEQIAVGRLLGVEQRSRSPPRAPVIAVGGVWDVAAGVADARRQHSGALSDQILHPPEAPSGQDRLLDGCVHVFHPPIRCLTMSNEGRVDVVPGQRGDSEIAATTLPSKERLPRSWSSLPSTTLSNVRRTWSPRSHPSSSTPDRSGRLLLRGRELVSPGHVVEGEERCPSGLGEDKAVRKPRDGVALDVRPNCRELPERFVPAALSGHDTHGVDTGVVLIEGAAPCAHAPSERDGRAVCAGDGQIDRRLRHRPLAPASGREPDRGQESGEEDTVEQEP